MEFIKNDLLDEVLIRNFQTFEITLDTADYVPAKYGKKIHKFIFKNMKKQMRKINSEYRKQKRATGGEADEACAASPPACLGANYVKPPSDI